MEPKSIHTYLDSRIADISAYDVDVRVTHFPHSADREWLYFFALQVNFTHYEEWSHGGFQWSGTPEFQRNANKGVNWGGGSDWAGYGGIGVNNTPFTWQCDMWYRYRVSRVDNAPQGYHRWLFAIMEYNTNTERPYGTVCTKSSFIKNALVFTETGYGVQCNSPKVRVEWRNPRIRTLAGELSPQKIVANYNGTCVDPTNTNQGFLSDSPLYWFHETNANRTIYPNKVLWQSN